MKKKKTGYILLLILLIGVVLFVYHELNSNPLSKYYTTKTLENYLIETYPNKELRIDEAIYLANRKVYSIIVTEIITTSSKERIPKKHEFILGGTFKPTVIVDSIYMDNLDQDLMAKLEKEAGQEIQSLLSKHVTSLDYVSAGFEIQKGEFPPDTRWSKDLKLKHPVSLFIVLNSKGASKEDVLKDAKEIQAILNENGYNYRSVGINSSVLQGEDIKELTYSTSFKRDTELKLRDIEEHNKRKGLPK